VRYLAVLLMVSLRMAGQGPVIARGLLLDSDSAENGEFSIRAQNNRVYWYVYDSKTYVERDNRLCTVSKLHQGDDLEIVSDTGPDDALRYARIIHVVESPAQNQIEHRQFSAGRYAMSRRTVAREDPLAIDLLFPRGSITFSGLVSQLNDERFVLRTRLGQQLIYRRPDTRYMKDGGVVAASSLAPNTRVYVRAGKNLDGEIEAYQVVWGQILAPDADH
jgi:hypothetical protein